MIKRLIASALVLLTLAACAEAPELVEPENVSVDTVTVTRGRYEKISQVNGYITPETVSLSFERDGTLAETLVRVGDTVKAGDTLVRLDTAEEEATLAELQTQRDRLCENDRLLDENAALQIELAQLKGTYDDIALELTQADELRAFDIETVNGKIDRVLNKLDGAVLTSPIDGTIVYINTESDIKRGETRVIIANEERLYICSQRVSYAVLTSAERLYTRIGDTEYELTYVENDSRSDAQTLLAGGKSYSYFEINADGIDLQAGQYAPVFVLSASADDVLTVPMDAIHASGTSRYVYVDVDGKRVQTFVSIGTSNGIDIIINDGLQEGDVVYVK